MAAENINQVYTANPITSNASTDLMYFGQSPYGVGDDAAMTFSNFASQFGSPYVAAALTRTNDTNVTLTLGGTPTTALLQATSLTLGWTGTLAYSRGGFGAAITAAAGGIFYSGVSSGALTAAGTSGQLLQSAGASAPGWTTNTFPSTDAKGDILYASATNTIGGLTIGSTGNILTVAAGLPAWTTATYPATATGTGTLLRANGTNWIASTSTFADTYGASTILYSNGANTVTGLATANNSVLATNGSGVPSLTTSLPTAVQVGVNSLNSGTSASSTTYWSGAGTWTTPTGTVPFSSQNVVTGSRVIGTVYQNTTGKTMYVAVVVGNGGVGFGSTQFVTDSSATPSTIVSYAPNLPATDGGNNTVYGMVLNNNYYECTSNSSPLISWTEWY